MLKKFSFMFLFAVPFTLQAQKETKETIVFQVVISPKQPAPENLVNYASVIETPLSPLTDAEIREVTIGKSESQKTEVINAAAQAKLQGYAKEKLAISQSKFSYHNENPQWIVKLKTSDVKVTATNEKPVGELSNTDWLFKFIYEATLTVEDQTGNVLYKADVGQSGQEQEMPKGVFFLNPAYKVRLGLVKNNPEKTKKIVDEMMQNKNALILENIIDQASGTLDDAYEVQVKTINLSLFSVKGKAYEELNVTNDKVKEAYANFRALSKKKRIPKEQVDQVMREAIPVWEKYFANQELEEKAVKGLMLNCAFASMWIGDHEKASSYLSKVPEAKMPETPVEEVQGGTIGATTFLGFEQSAENAYYSNQIMVDYKNRVAIAD